MSQAIAPRSEIAATRALKGADAFTAQPSLEAQKAWLVERGIPNPYFTLHDGIAGAHTSIGGRDMINFSSYNYIGLSGDAEVSAAAKAAIDRYGTSVSASRIVSGERPVHRELEEALASLVGAEDCLSFVSGHGTNVTVVGELVGPGDLVLHDSYIHNSLQMGCTLSGARRMIFLHNSWSALERLLTRERANYKRVLILVEGVYSMDGDLPDLPALIELKRRFNAQVMIDEAHSMGVLGAHGRGVGEHYGVDPKDIDLWMGTLSKSFASCGGYVAGSHDFIETLRYRAPGFVFSVGMPAPAAAAALAAVQKLRAEPERAARVRARAESFRVAARARGWNIGKSHDSPIVPVILRESERALRVSQALMERGINIQPIIFPAVSRNQARLRLFFCSEHSEADIDYTVRALEEILAAFPDKSVKPAA
jgi:8-amino-7-oxononanoate synthase